MITTSHRRAAGALAPRREGPDGALRCAPRRAGHKRAWRDAARRVSVIALLGLLSLSFGACAPPPRPLGDQCDLDTECAYPLVCRLARCRRECATVRDCPLGQLCVPAKDLGVCLLPDEVTCALRSDCPEPLVCAGGRCANECAGPRDCAPGAVCHVEDGLGRCTDASEDAPTCRLDSDCDASLACVSGRCGPRCLADRDCAFGLSCEAGRCVRLDASVDAGGSDAGIDDAGEDAPAELDAGLDAGSDAGPQIVDTCTTPDDCRAPGVDVFGCVGDACTIVACAAGREDCNGAYGDGCEATLAVDPDHCAECGRSCGPGGSCAAGACDGLVDLAVGNEHLCFVRENGRALCMGSNSNGALGIGSVDIGGARHVPEPVLGGPDDFVRVTAGNGLSCVAGADGRAWCWGAGTYGQLGNGRFGERHTAQQVVGLTGAVQVSTSGGVQFACARTGGGAVFCWGDNALGQLGDGTTTTRSTPVPVTGLTDAVDLSVGSGTVCAVRASGAVVCWGSDQSGALGDGPGSPETCGSTACSRVPVPVVGVADATQVHVGFRTVCVRRATGAVACWGDNFNGQLGVGQDRTALPSADAPLPLSLADVVEVRSGILASCARHTSGTVSCWGSNAWGTVGDGSGVGSTVPVAVAGLADATVLSVSGAIACALRAAGGAACWGGPGGAMFGLTGSAASTPQPVPLALPVFP